MTALALVYFYSCAALALAGALAVLLAQNPIRGAMGLLLLTLAVAGLFLALHAQFLASIQLIVYAGAVVVLFLFVIMLLGPLAPHGDQRGLFVRLIGGGLFAASGLGAILLVARSVKLAFPTQSPDSSFGGIDAFGGVLFSDAIAPFELSSALLLVAVVGAVAVARGRQGVAALSKDERAAAQPSPHAGSPGEGSGVFSHEIHAHETEPAP
jgi:NADH-quinone oxidoreductase subunit J